MAEELKLGYDDVTIVPEPITTITSRSECNPFDSDGFLPIFASCMSSVVSMENTKDFNEVKIRTVIPRSYSVAERLSFLMKDEYNFVAFSLEETITEFLEKNFALRSGKTIRICIDLANGHMQKLLTTISALKDLYGSTIVIMSGNIANPQSYAFYDAAGCDYVRVSVGTGDVCSTSSNTGVGYPIFSLLKETYEIKKENNGKCKIIADGGIKIFRDIQKALVFADYVMIGSLFNKAMESAAKTTYGSFYWNLRGKKIYRPIKTLINYGKEVPKYDYGRMYKLVKENKLTVWKEHFGMSTKIAQSLIASANSKELKSLKTSEGLYKYQKVEYNLKGWAENETDFLRSAMSYTDSRTLDEYKNSMWVRISKIYYNK